MRISDWSSDVCSSDLSIHDDLAETGCHRPDLRLDAVRQVLGRLPQPFANLLARKIKIGGFREYGGNLAEPIAREGPRRFKPRTAGEGNFDRVGDRKSTSLNSSH